MSYLGSVLDPIADKILVGVLTVSLSITHLIPGKRLYYQRNISYNGPPFNYGTVHF